MPSKIHYALVDTGNKLIGAYRYVTIAAVANAHTNMWQWLQEESDNEYPLNWKQLLPKDFSKENIVGKAYIYPDDPEKNTAYAQGVWVDEAYRRQGIASGMYQYLQDKTGLKMRPDRLQTEMGRKLWENKKFSSYKYASTQINLPSELAKKVLALGADIPDEDLGNDGREMEAHLTIKYGIDGDEEEAIREAVKDFPQFEIILGTVTFFPPRNEDGTPVIIEVVLSDELKKFHDLIMDVAGIKKDEFPYAPHVTLAYVKDEETAEKYSGDSALKGEKFVATSLVLSKLNGDKVSIPLDGEKFVSPLLQKKSSVKTAAEIGPVYHGTPNMFDEFSPQEVKNRSMGLFGISYTVKTHAYFFTPDSRVAWNWAQNRITEHYDKKYVKKCFITLSNPINFRTSAWIDEDIVQPDLPLDKKKTRYTLLEELREMLGDNFRWNDYGIDAGQLRVDEPGLEWKLLDNKDFVDAIKHLGYDGAICDEGEGEFGGVSYAVFSPNQIRVVKTHTGAHFASHLLTAKLPNVDMSQFKRIMQPMLPLLRNKNDDEIRNALNEITDDTNIQYQLTVGESGNADQAQNYLKNAQFMTDSGLYVVQLEYGIGNLFEDMTEQSWEYFLKVLSALIAHEATHKHQLNNVVREYRGDPGKVNRALQQMEKSQPRYPNDVKYFASPHEIAAFARQAVEELREINYTDKQIAEVLRSSEKQEGAGFDSATFSTYRELFGPQYGPLEPGDPYKDVYSRFLKEMFKVLENTPKKAKLLHKATLTVRPHKRDAEFKVDGERLGLEYWGTQNDEDFPQLAHAVFQDPISGTSVTVMLKNYSLEKLNEVTSEARKRMGKAASGNTTLDVFYHGTSWPAADRIKNEGLKAQKWYAGPGKYVWCTLLEKEARAYGQLESRSPRHAVVTFVWPYNKTKPDPEHFERGDLYRRISTNIPETNIIGITYYENGKIIKKAYNKLSPNQPGKEYVEESNGWADQYDRREGDEAIIPLEEVVPQMFKESVETPALKPLKFVKDDRATDQTLIMVNTAALDRAWSKDEGYYISPGGTGNAIGSRYDRFKDWLKQHSNEAIRAPMVSWNDVTDCVSFTDGRHRFSALRDMGYPTVKISVPKEQVDLFKQKMKTASVQSFNDHKEAKLIRKLSGNQNEALKKVVKILGENGIGSIVVGAVSLQEHGYPRSTKDIDLSVSDVKKAKKVLLANGYTAIEDQPASVVDLENGEEIDLLQSGLAVALSRVPMPIPIGSNITPEFCDLPALIDLKIGSFLGAEAGGSVGERMQDKADVHKLILSKRLSRDLLQGKVHQREYEHLWDILHFAKKTSTEQALASLVSDGLSDFGVTRDELKTRLAAATPHVAAGETLLWIMADGTEHILQPGETHGTGAMRLWHLSDRTPYWDAVAYGLMKGAVRISDHRKDTAIYAQKLRNSASLISDYLSGNPKNHEVIIEWKEPKRDSASFANSEEALWWLDNSFHRFGSRKLASPFDVLTKEFLNQWSYGNNQAPRKLVPTVLDELKQTVKEDSYALYRGYKFDNEFWAKEKFGIDWEALKQGQTVSLSITSATSWSKSKDIAEKFADPRYNSFAGQIYEDAEIRDLGIEEGDEIGLSLLVEAIIPAAMVIADLTQISSSLLNGKDEQEVIVKGDVTAKVVMLRRVNWDPEDEPEENYTDNFESLTPAQEEAIKRLTEESLKKMYLTEEGDWVPRKQSSDQAPLQAAQRIMNEFLKEFWPDLPIPKLIVVNHTRPNLLGSCKWSSDDPDTSFIEIQKSATGDEKTLKRVISHELCHHAEYMLHHRTLPLDKLKSVESIYGHHGKWWQDEARKVNARYGANFVTKTSDAAMVISG
jgi:2'-5' RNA ligase